MRSMPSRLRSSKRPMKGEMNVAPAFAPQAPVGGKAERHVDHAPSAPTHLQAFSPSQVRHLDPMFSAISPARALGDHALGIEATGLRPRRDLRPSRRSRVTSRMSRPDLAMSEGFVDPVDHPVVVEFADASTSRYPQRISSRSLPFATRSWQLRVF